MEQQIVAGVAEDGTVILKRNGRPGHPRCPVERIANPGNVRHLIAGREVDEYDRRAQGDRVGQREWRLGGPGGPILAEIPRHDRTAADEITRTLAVEVTEQEAAQDAALDR